MVTAPDVTGTTPTNNVRPTWNWTAGGGTGTFRYRLDHSDLTAGSTVTTATTFSPGSDLREAAHTLKSGDNSASTVRSTETGKTYLISSGESATTQPENDTAIGGHKEFTGVVNAAAITAYTITVASGLTDGTYDLVTVDFAGNVPTVVGGWLSVVDQQSRHPLPTSPGL